jgi:hypothetical protein
MQNVDQYILKNNTLVLGQVGEVGWSGARNHTKVSEAYWKRFVSTGADIVCLK